MMVGTVVRMVMMMSSTEAHRLFGLFSKQVDLYLTGDLRVKRIMTAPRALGHAAAGVSFASPVK
jgi:hypothetical protein